jgi:hypothetical protein
MNVLGKMLEDLYYVGLAAAVVFMPRAAFGLNG